MLQVARLNFRDRTVGICAAFGLASAMAAGGAAVAPTVASASATSPNAPVMTLRPHLAGSAAQGSVITLTPGTFSNETTQDGTWYQCPTAASNKCTATKNRGSSYTVSASDPVGDYIRLDEVATNASGTNTVWSNVIGPIAAASAPSTPAGSSSSSYTGSCTKTISPGADPAAAESSMSAGQVLCLNSGTYQSITQSSANVFSASGTSGSPIVVTSGPGQTATIQGADYINGNNVTFQYMNLDQADVLYSSNGGSNPAPCAYPLSEGMQINGNNITIQNDNVYESSHRGVLIGIGYGGSPTNQSSGDIIRNDNLGPAGGCSDSQHLIYADYTSGLQVYQNWFFDDPYGFGVQLYQADTNAQIHSNVFDNVLAATVESSSTGGNVTSHNVAINSAAVSKWSGFTGMFTDCYSGNGDTISDNAIFNMPNGFGSCSAGVTVSGAITLAANPFVGGQNSDNYVPANNAAASQLAGYGLWNGQGAPSPNPALSFPADPANTATVNGVPVPTA